MKTITHVIFAVATVAIALLFVQCKSETKKYRQSRYRHGQPFGYFRKIAYSIHR